MEYLFTQKERLLTEHVNPKQELRLSWVLRFMQEAAIGGVTKIGYPREKTLDRGLLWVVGKQRVEIARLPKYDEEITVSTYPGKKFFRFFQRHTFFESASGEPLIKANAVWALIDYKNRQMIDPDKYGIIVPEEKRDGEMPFPPGFQIPALDEQIRLKASWRDCDLNGHINNCAYLDIAEDLIPTSFLLERSAKSIDITYKQEIKLGEEIDLRYGRSGSDWFFDSDRFLLRIKYE